MAKFATLYSSSSGNSAYIEEGGGVLLIDCGKNCKTTVNALYSHGIAAKDVKGILLTHEHTDHVAGLAVLLKHYHIPVYGHKETLGYLVRENLVPSRAVINPVVAGDKFSIGDFEITPFETSHDSLGAHGYRIKTGQGRTMCYATDTGIVSNELLQSLCGCDLVALESNYDAQMLKYGRYPQFLKRRIDGARGHLSNHDCAQVAVEIAKSGVNRFVFCHLSKENNRPERVSEAILTAFVANGINPDEGGYVGIAPSDEPLVPVEF